MQLVDFKNFNGWGILFGIPAIFLLAFIYPHIPHADSFEICAIRSFLQIDCPGCGLTRSFAAITHGLMRKSIDLHPLGIIVFSWLAYLWGRSFLAVVLGKNVPELLKQGQRDFLTGVFVIALFAHWIVKFIVD